MRVATFANVGPFPNRPDSIDLVSWELTGETTSRSIELYKTSHMEILTPLIAALGLVLAALSFGW
jgi:hypothetical protein